jgi:hypothetical protein
LETLAAGAWPRRRQKAAASVGKPYTWPLKKNGDAPKLLKTKEIAELARRLLNKGRVGEKSIN